MKVLELTCEPILHGGQEAFIFNCLENIVDKDVSIDVLTLYYCKNDHYQEIAQYHGSKIYELNIDFKPGKSRRLIKRPLRRFLEKNKYNIAHIHSGSISALAYSAEIARKAGIEHVIVHSHSTGVNNIKHKLIQSYFSYKFKRYVTTYCACSVEAGLMKFPKSVSDKIVILKNGVDLERFKYDSENREKIRRRLSIPQDAYLVGQIGRFTFEKNQQYTISIAKKIKQKEENIYFLFIGDGELREQAKELARNNNYIIFIDSQDDVWKYYSAFDLLVLPSIYEGIPLVSIEAQSNGLPILASNGVSKEIEINDNVVRVDLRNKEKWVEIINNHKLLRMTSVERLIMSGWDIKGVADKIIGIYYNEVE